MFTFIQFLQFFRNNVVANYMAGAGETHEPTQEDGPKNEFDNLTAKELVAKIQEDKRLDDKDSQELDALLKKLESEEQGIIGKTHELLADAFMDSVTEMLTNSYTLSKNNEEANYDVFKKVATFLGKEVPENFASIQTVLVENGKDGEVSMTLNGEIFTVHVNGDRIGSINNKGEFSYSDTFGVFDRNRKEG